MDDYIQRRMKENGDVFRNELERIVQKYSRVDGSGVEVCLQSMTCQTETGIRPWNGEEAERLMTTLGSFHDSADKLVRGLDNSGGTQDGSHTSFDCSSVPTETQMERSTESVFWESGADGSQLLSSAVSESALQEVLELPEEQDEELERTLSSPGSSLLQLYPSMLSQVGRAWHRQHVTEAASAVLRRYRRRGWRSSTHKPHPHSTTPKRHPDSTASNPHSAAPKLHPHCTTLNPHRATPKPHPHSTTPKRHPDSTPLNPYSAAPKPCSYSTTPKRRPDSTALNPHSAIPKPRSYSTTPKRHPDSNASNPYGAAPKPHPHSTTLNPHSATPKPHRTTPKSHPHSTTPKRHPDSNASNPHGAAPKPHPHSTTLNPHSATPKPHRTTPKSHPHSTAPKRHPDSAASNPHGTVPKPHPHSTTSKPGYAPWTGVLQDIGAEPAVVMNTSSSPEEHSPLCRTYMVSSSDTSPSEPAEGAVAFPPSPPRALHLPPELAPVPAWVSPGSAQNTSHPHFSHCSPHPSHAFRLVPSPQRPPPPDSSPSTQDKRPRRSPPASCPPTRMCGQSDGRSQSRRSFYAFHPARDQIDLEFEKLYHRIVCQRTVAPPLRSHTPSHLKPGVHSCPSWYSPSLAALALSPLWTRVGKRVRDLEPGVSPESKRFRELCTFSPGSARQVHARGVCCWHSHSCPHRSTAPWSPCKHPERALLPESCSPGISRQLGQAFRKAPGSGFGLQIYNLPPASRGDDHIQTAPDAFEGKSPVRSRRDWHSGFSQSSSRRRLLYGLPQ